MNETKICVRCERKLPKSSFRKQTACKDGLQNRCKACSSLEETIRYQKKREEILSRNNKWNRENRESQLVYNKKRAEKIRNIPIEKTKRRIHSRFLSFFNRKRNLNKHIPLIGCTISKLKAHLEKQFTSEMTWENRGTYWVIDHIIPRATFNLLEESEQFKCYNYLNLRPLTKDQNIRKQSCLRVKFYHVAKSKDTFNIFENQRNSVINTDAHQN